MHRHLSKRLTFKHVKIKIVKIKLVTCLHYETYRFNLNSFSAVTENYVQIINKCLVLRCIFCLSSGENAKIYLL